MEDEFAFHLEERARELEARGLSPAAARDEALRHFGDVQDALTYCRDVDARRERGAMRVEWMSEIRQDASFAWRTLARAPGFALVAIITLAVGIVLSAVGIYGVIAYLVTMRTRELGIRIALGASHGDVLRLVPREGIVVAAIGLVVGTAGALALSRLLSGLRFEVAPTDPLTFALLAATLAAVALAASFIPARRASRLDPLVAIRAE